MIKHGLKNALLVSGLLAAGAGAAAAAPVITIQSYSSAAYGNEIASLIGGGTLENFETITKTPGEIGDGTFKAVLKTGVGTFETTSTTDNTGGGTSVIDTGGALGGGGDTLALHNKENFGRKNTTAGGSWFLDSNDTDGMLWTVGLADNASFNKLVFTLSDANDVGARLRVTAKGGAVQDYEIVGNAQASGVINLIVVTFSELIDAASVKLQNFASNSDTAGLFTKDDGFAVDDVAVGAVPLPAGVLLLASAMGGFGVARRLRKTA